MLKNTVFLGIAFCSIILVGCTGEQTEEKVQHEVTEASNGDQKVVFASKSRENNVSNLLSELKEEIIVSITEQTAFERDSITMMLDGATGEGNFEISCFVGFPKDAKIDETKIQQIVDDTIMKVSKTENVTISEENITIKIEKY
ncbi:topoisomerase [Cytobacillus massiliigabonensis]|uniref:topoisomerase n=1 Tax=Cytobacillus massiliigabonensis TaxID=1871011 RepID=UPI001F27F53A|nr:topoisomerase [Cytobacillus massiliigabonensis]